MFLQNLQVVQSAGTGDRIRISITNLLHRFKGVERTFVDLEGSKNKVYDKALLWTLYKKIWQNLALVGKVLHF